MIEQNKQQEQLKKFNFFGVENVQQQILDPKTHPIKLTDVYATDIVMVKSKILLLDESNNKIMVFGKCIEGEWRPHSESTMRMFSTNSSFNEVVVTYGEDAESQMKSNYVKLWTLEDGNTKYEQMKPRKTILIGKLGEPEKILSSLHLMNDCTILTIGTKRGTLLVYQSKNLIQNEPKFSMKIFDKKQIKLVQNIKRINQIDVYFTNEEAFYWFENLSEKRRIFQREVEIMQSFRNGNIVMTFKNDNKFIYEYRGGKEIRSHTIQGQKKIIREFKSNYLIVVTLEKKNQKHQKSTDKYFVHILDTLNQYIAFSEPFHKVQNVLTNQFYIVLVVCNERGERSIKNLTEKDNSFKIETFFKRSFYNEAWRFAKNQKCQESLLAEISRLHGDLLYSKSDSANAIKQYILTLGFVEPSYVIKKFLDVSQIDYLIEYLQKIHQKKLAKKEHTALLLNCYVKKQKIQNLSSFLSEASLESDLFDIETAIKVCKDLTHFDEAMKLAQQKNKHELYLKILIQNKKDYEKALEYIRIKVPLEEKQKYLIEFGQEFMKFIPKKAIELIKLLIRAHSISQIIRGKQRDYVLTPDEKNLFEQLFFDTDELQNLTVITFKKPDEFFRLFMVNNQDLQNFLLYLIKDVPKLPHEQIVFHRLIQFYLQMMKESPSRRDEFAKKIIENLSNPSRKPDNNVLLSLFKMYDFDDGIIMLCKKEEGMKMKDDLLNFYISKNRDQDIMELCKEHGVHDVNLWMHALKYYAKPDAKKQSYIPEILNQLTKIPNFSPLPVLSILSKSKNIEYHYIKSFFLEKLKEDKQDIQNDREIVKKNLRKAEESRGQFKKLKTTAKPFLSNNCSHCQNGLTFPSIYFMCGHSFHQNCLGGERQCEKCRFDMRNKIERKQKFAEEVRDNVKLFETLKEKKQSAFEVVSEFLGRGLFLNKNEKN